MSLGDRLRTWAKRSDTVRRWREQRYNMFVELCSVKPEERILDVGAGEGSALERFNATNPIVAVDLETDERDWLQGENVTVQRADGTQLPFADGSFPIVFSNSVIEHLPAPRLQTRMETEMRRVGRRLYLQTPNRYFPLEPHFLYPLFAVLPLDVRAFLQQHLDLGWHPRQPNRAAALREVRSIRLMTGRELRRAFPGARIERERILVLTKSFIVLDGWDPQEG